MSVPNDVYWADRFAILEEIQNQDGREQIRKLKRAYKKAISDIEKDVSAWYERFATNEGITLGEARKILDAGQLDAFKMSVEDYIAKGESLDPKWRADLERASVKVHISRLEALKLQMQQHVEELTSGMQSLMDDYAESSYKKQYYRTAFEVQKGIRLGWDLQKLDKTQVSKVVRKPWAADGTNFSDRIWNNRTKLVNELHTTLTSSIARGENPTKTIEKLSTKMHNSEFNAGRVVMTEGAFFASAAKQDAFKTLDVEKYEIVATLDRKTSNICRDMDGKIFERKDYVIGSTAPPFHPFCRTTTAPYFDDANDSVRAARNNDGEYYEVPANMTYREWEQTFIDGGSKEGLKPANETDLKDGVLGINTASQVYQKLGEKHYLKMHDLLQSNGTETHRKVWAKYEGDLGVTTIYAKDKETAYFSPTKKGITFNLKQDAKGSDWQAPYQTAFHEFGHNIDYLARDADNFYYSEHWRNGSFANTLRREITQIIKDRDRELKQLHKTLSEEAWKEYQEKIGSYSGDITNQYRKRIAYKAIEHDLLAIPVKLRSSLSDLFGGVTLNKISAGFGHSTNYWKDRKDSGVPREAFAEFWECIANPEQWDELQKWLPKATALFIEMLEELLTNE